MRQTESDQLTERKKINGKNCRKEERIERIRTCVCVSSEAKDHCSFPVFDLHLEENVFLWL